MVSVVMECRNQERPLAVSLAALVPGAVEGLVREVLVIDRGSTDGSWKVADAAGCTFLKDGDVRSALSAARSSWIFLMEPGARPLSGWIDRFNDHMTISRSAARLSPAADHGPRLLERLRGARQGLRYGVLMPLEQALAAAQDGEPLERLGRGVKTRRLDCAIIPASAL